MLECGYAAPFDGIRGIERAERTFDDTVATMICMERYGYSYSEGSRQIRVCERFKSNAACQPGATIPMPDRNRRLSSGYCKKYAQAKACAP